jgi:hypothetical protein
LKTRIAVPIIVRGGERDPVILVAFKAIDPVLRGQDGGFDSHTLPPYPFDVSDVKKTRQQKAATRDLWPGSCADSNGGTDGNWVSDSQSARAPTGRANFSVQSIFPRTPFLDNFRMADNPRFARRCGLQHSDAHDPRTAARLARFGSRLEVLGRIIAARKLLYCYL